jgi:hypothetical protein
VRRDSISIPSTLQRRCASGLLCCRSLWTTYDEQVRTTSLRTKCLRAGGWGPVNSDARLRSFAFVSLAFGCLGVRTRGDVPAEILVAAAGRTWSSLGKRVGSIGTFRKPGTTCLAILSGSRIPVLIMEQGATLAALILAVNDGTPGGIEL